MNKKNKRNQKNKSISQNKIDDNNRVNHRIYQNNQQNGQLYVVATPIGNLQDITLRAITTLKECDVILAENTAITYQLLKYHHIENKKILPFHDKPEEIESALADIKNGKKYALLSDAGTPLVSDPGAKLIKEARMDKKIVISPLPGVSAVTAALSVSGIDLECGEWAFFGFLSHSTKQKNDQLQKIKIKEITAVIFESPNRLLDTLQQIEEIFGKKQQICVARELTKIYEEVFTAEVSLIKNFYQEKAKIKGEIVIIISTEKCDMIYDEEQIDFQKIHLAQKIFSSLFANDIPLSQAAKIVSQSLDISKNTAYALGAKNKKKCKNNL